MPYTSLLLAGSLTLSIVVAACSSGETPTATGTLSGRLLLICCGGRGPGVAQPLSGTVKVVGPSGERTQVQVDSDGVFSVDLPAATYTVAGGPPIGSHLPCPTDSGVVVTAGTTTSTDLTCRGVD